TCVAIRRIFKVVTLEGDLAVLNDEVPWQGLSMRQVWVGHDRVFLKGDNAARESSLLVVGGFGGGALDLAWQPTHWAGPAAVAGQRLVFAEGWPRSASIVDATDMSAIVAHDKGVLYPDYPAGVNAVTVDGETAIFSLGRPFGVKVVDLAN